LITNSPNSNKNKTFKPKKNIPEGTKQYQLKKYAEATLGSGNLRLAVMLPEGEDFNEWLAVNSKSLMQYMYSETGSC
jgi:MOB kinase activator 1